VATRPDYITVGRFGRPRGYSGDIHITPATDDPRRFLDLTEVYTIVDGKRRKLTLETVTMIGDRPVVRVTGITTKEEAATLTNLTIEIPGSLTRPLPEGSYYQFDLVGCRVIGVDGEDYGTLEEVLFYPANDLYRIYSEKYGEALLPAVDTFIKRVDIEAREIIIDPPDGLFTGADDTIEDSEC